MNLPEDVLHILNTLNQNDFESYIVGGCVRDSLLNIVPKDWDITTNATPEETKSLFAHTFDTGIEHGTITVVLNKENYEVTTYRIDGKYEDCRRPTEVAFTANLEEDLLRRDFTMNAIAYHPKEGYQDFFHGMEDIQNKIIRGVGDPATRFQEDALRMLRCLRFSAQLGFIIDAQTYEALQENIVLIQKISQERIRIELEKLFLSPHTEKIPLLWECGILEKIDPLLHKNITQTKDLLPQLTASEKKSVLCWSIVLQNHTVTEAKQFFKKLKFDNFTAKHVCIYLPHFQNTPDTSLYGIRKLIGQIGLDCVCDVYALKYIQTNDPQYHIHQKTAQEIVTRKDCCTIKELAINGTDLMKLGVPKGQQLGDILGELLELVLREPNQNELSILSAIVKELIQKNE